MSQLAPPPTYILEKDGRITKAYSFWLLSLTEAIDASAQAVPIVSVPAQTAALPTTALLTVSAAGLFRVSWYARITTPASVSSALTVTVGHTESGLSIAQSGASMTGNTTTTVQSGSVFCDADAATPITVATAYASVGTPMGYTVRFVVELVG